MVQHQGPDMPFVATLHPEHVRCMPRTQPLDVSLLATNGVDDAPDSHDRTHVHSSVVHQE